MKPGETVIITKPGKFHGLEGKIVSVQYTVDLGPYGEWSFNRIDLQSSENKSVSNPSQNHYDGGIREVPALKDPSFKPEKRAYNRRDASIEKPAKRKYTKKTATA